MTPRIARMGDWDSSSNRVSFTRFVVHNHLMTLTILIRVTGVIRGRPNSVRGIRDFGELGAVQLRRRSHGSLAERLDHIAARLQQNA